MYLVLFAIQQLTLNQNGQNLQCQATVPELAQLLMQADVNHVPNVTGTKDLFNMPNLAKCWEILLPLRLGNVAHAMDYTKHLNQLTMLSDSLIPLSRYLIQKRL
jgi:hypothetical protein